MKFFHAVLLAFAFVTAAHARPVVIEETATIYSPSPSWQYFGRFGVAIDGDYALISGERYVADPSVEGGQRHLGTVLLYQRNGATWSLIGQLGPTVTLTDLPPGLAMKDGVAVTITDRWRMWERNGSTFTLTAIPNLPAQGVKGPDIEIDGGRILFSRVSCTQDAVVYRKINGVWSKEGDLPGDATGCPAGLPAQSLDISGTRATVVQNMPDPEYSYERNYRLNASGTGWTREGGQGPGFRVGNLAFPGVAVNGPIYVLSANRQLGSQVNYDYLSGGTPTCCAISQAGGVQTVDTWMEPNLWSATPIEHVGPYFAQRNYSYDRRNHVITLFDVDETAPYANHILAQLQPRSNAPLGDQIDWSGNRIIVNDAADGEGGHAVYIYELPESFETTLPLQQHDFELASDGALWQPTAGSAFTVVRAGNTGVYRQSDTTNTAVAYLPDTTSADQAIQSELTFRAVNGPNAWAGLVVRRKDEANYYYVTLRASGSVELKRMSQGQFFTLASAAAPVTIGAKYRLRFEAIGSQFRVYLNEWLILTAVDNWKIQGTAGVITNRAAVDYDNVIVSPSPYTTILKDDFNDAVTGPWPYSSVEGVYRLSYLADHARVPVGALTHDQIVQFRVRANSFVDPQTSSVGALMRWYSDRDHAFVSWQGRGVITLSRRINGAVQPLVLARVPLTAGQWYTLRVEAVGSKTRVFVDDQLVLSSNVDLGPDAGSQGWAGAGRVGVATYKATADFDDFNAYQP
jgi:hypothetical protein